MSNKLLPCPFCGTQPVIVRIRDESLWSHDQVVKTRVECGGCDIATDYTEEGQDPEAIEKWNTRAASPAPVPDEQAVKLTVWFGSLPESNGRENWTVMLHRVGESMTGGVQIYRSEYKDRARYEADCLRHLIGELAAGPDILAYDAELHSGYTAPSRPVAAEKREPHTSEQRARPDRFVPSPDGRSIDDDDFIYDATLKVTGDFADDATRHSYAQWICDRLNAGGTHPSTGEDA